MSANAMANGPRDACCDAKNGALAAFSPRARRKRRENRQGRRSKTPAGTFEDAALPRFRSCGALFLSSKARLRNNAQGSSRNSAARRQFAFCNLRWMKTIDNSHREWAAKRPVSCAARTTKSFGRGFRHQSGHFKPVAAAERGAFRRPSEPAPIHRTA